MNGRRQNPNDPLVTAAVQSTLTPASRPGIAALAWNWRWEIGILALLAAAATAIAVTSGLLALAAATGAALAVIALLLWWPAARRRLVARLWCIVTPHRVRAGCAQAWVQTRQGRLPIVVWTSPADYGERVLLWCRAGITTHDVVAAREILAAACWAADVRVLPHQHRAHLVRLEIIRHLPERAVVTPQHWPDTDQEEEDPLVMSNS